MKVRVGVRQVPAGDGTMMDGPAEWVEINGYRLPLGVLSVRHEAEANKFPAVTIVLEGAHYEVADAADEPAIKRIP